MLGKLVNKFKKQSINDQGLSPPKTVSSAPALLDCGERQVRKSARLNPGLFPNVGFKLKIMENCSEKILIVILIQF